MKKFLLAVGLLSIAGTAMAAKDCEELKGEIAAKIEANGASGYSLQVVEKGSTPSDHKVVGTCDGGTKEIAYKRG
ncbi:DUF1161 domain-containing protein [Pseudomonas haemolytica]|uniref:DUF1161 domain-containing protein n=1 Tax=Pseudomonas haemolytica TaxID=2600065 RepID=A0A5P1DD93_9PSED|nr:DUF1161 domain-containing protein [Pseudomonas haemolytica]MBJ2245933.1 DUF1161 domain-containing protein [Pseudomonas haemolytica]MBJ2273629.1 DUF1161 domain-containing protein [Pseudomonas haemolytica]MBK3449094.1 DUF1161 domain-containing protein [Pseudomonas haemolytica]MBK3460390.1 DUF1161 domain-containing protein [Pseudomonas haemolytica]MRJ18804.1 DUF1161 domain-containing protein [Pseudomonas haemolytica]